MTVSRRKFLRAGGLITAGLAVGNLETINAQTAETAMSANALSFLCQPYLQHLTPNEVTIMWITNNAGCYGWVEYGKNGQLTQKKQESNRGLLQANVRINRVRLKGLTPGTTYSYCVCSQEITEFKAYSLKLGSTIKSLTYMFTTPGLDDDAVSALVFNDIHDNTALYQRLIGLSNMPDYDFVFLNGDILDQTPNEARILSSIISPCVSLFASKKPFALVRGNHETRDAFARSFFDYFQLGADNKGYYSFSRGPVLFIVLDSGEDKEDSSLEYSGLVDFDAYREEQAGWLENLMKTDTYQQASYRVVFMHIPPFESGDWHGTMHCRSVFNPLFNQYKVDLVISGHTHRYGIHQANAERSYPIVIGGGKGTSATTSTSNATIIKLRANREVLVVEIIDYNGKTVGLHSVIPRSGSSFRQQKEIQEHEKIYTEGKSLFIESDRSVLARIYNTSGVQVREALLSPGTTQVEGLALKQVYFIHIETQIYKTILY